MTPLLAALSSLRLVATRSSLALSLSPAAAASRNERIAVRSEDFTDWLRSRAASLVRIRFTWDLMLATRKILSSLAGYGRESSGRTHMHRQARLPVIGVRSQTGGGTRRQILRLC